MAVQILWKHIFHTPERPLQTFQTSSSSSPNPLQTSCLALTCFFLTCLYVRVIVQVAGVCSREYIPKGTRFGPLVGEIYTADSVPKDANRKYFWRVSTNIKDTHNSRNTYFLRSRRDPFLWRHAHLKSVTEQEIGFAVFCVCVSVCVSLFKERRWGCDVSVYK